MKPSIIKLLYFVSAILAVSGQISSGAALLLGVVLAVLFGNPFATQTKEWTHRLLALSVVGLGFGMNLGVIGKIGAQGVVYTFVGISLTFILGTLLGKILKVEKDTSLLITVGTAICGGSAIAAISPTIHARQEAVSVSLGTVFLLNALALFLFPLIGHQFNLDQTQFGLWCALAIHDTSSVVGASMQYGPEALKLATTLKLARALWIIPVSVFVGFLYSRKKADTTVLESKKPWFILGFILAAALVTFFPVIEPIGHFIERIAKHLLILTLFLIGSSLTKTTLKAVGIRPFFLGILLWILISSATLCAIMNGTIHI